MRFAVRKHAVLLALPWPNRGDSLGKGIGVRKDPFAPLPKALKRKGYVSLGRLGPGEDRSMDTY